MDTNFSTGTGIVLAGWMIAAALVVVGKLLTSALTEAAHRYTDAMQRQADVFDASTRHASSRRGES